MNCVECSEPAVGTCSSCGSAKCGSHMIMKYESRRTGTSVGPWAVVEEGYVSTGLCLSCLQTGEVAEADALRSATDLQEIAARIRVHVSSPVATANVAAWGIALRDTWRDLAARGAVGAATHEVVQVVVGGAKVKRLPLTEVSRSPAWRAPSAGQLEAKPPGGTLESHPMDLWIDAGGEVWAPYIAAHPGGSLAMLETTTKGEVYSPDVLDVVVRPGAIVRSVKSRGTVELDGIVVTTQHEPASPFNPSYNLGDAVVGVIDAAS